MAEYISRDDVRRFIADAFSENYFSTNYAYAILVDKIDELPAADVQPVKHGYWVEEEPRVLKCSVCGEYAPMNYLGQNCIDSRYCPWCGTKLECVK